MAVVGTTDGNLYAHTARDPLQVGKHQAHTSAVTAMVRTYCFSQDTQARTLAYKHTHDKHTRQTRTTNTHDKHTRQTRTTSAHDKTHSTNTHIQTHQLCNPHEYTQDVGHIAATGAKVVASGSAEQLIIHDVVIKTSELRLLANVSEQMKRI
jgi:hypothetical protein